MLSAWPTLIIKFMAAPTEYRCKNDEEELSSPILPPVDVSNITEPRCLCDSWTFDQTEFYLTIIQQYELVCNNKYFVYGAQSVFGAGLMTGVFFMGYFADRFGRKPTILIALMIMLSIGTTIPFMPNVESFLALRYFQGFTKMGVFTVVFIWCMEQVGGTYKTYVGVGLEFPWVLAWLMLALLGYLIPNWQYLSWITSIPGFLCIALFWIMPESPKWLLTVGNVQEAETIIKRAAVENGRTLGEDWKLEPLAVKQKGTSRGNIFNLFKTKNMAIKTLVLFFSWFTNSFIYYGLTFNTGKIAGSFYLNFVLNGVLEIPAYLISLFVILKIGRKLPYLILMMTSGISLFCTIIVPRDVYQNNWPIIVLALVGKMCITGAWAIMYVYSAEIYPTVCRSIGIGASSVCARLGLIIAPYIGGLAETHGPTFPIAIFGITAILATAFSVILPETKFRQLPDTIEDGESVKTSFKEGIFQMNVLN